MTASFAAAQAGAAYGMSYAFGFGQAYRPLFAAGAAALFVAAVCFFASGRQRLAVQRP